jgi:hypothetical protein
MINTAMPPLVDGRGSVASASGWAPLPATCGAITRFGRAAVDATTPERRNADTARPSTVSPCVLAACVAPSTPSCPVRGKELVAVIARGGDPSLVRAGGDGAWFPPRLPNSPRRRLNPAAGGFSSISLRKPGANPATVIRSTSSPKLAVYPSAETFCTSMTRNPVCWENPDR